MKIRKLPMLFATLSIASYMEATESPMPRTSHSFVEVASNTIYHHSGNIHSEQVQIQFIDKYLNELHDNPNTYIKIVSHTDDIGDWEANLNISKKRALDIAEYLKDYGVPQDRIILDWLGEDAPLFFKPEEKHKNARTNLRIIKKVKKVVFSNTLASQPSTPTKTIDKFTGQASASSNSTPKIRTSQVKTQPSVRNRDTIHDSSTTKSNWRTVIKEKQTTKAERKVVIKKKPTVKIIHKSEEFAEKGVKIAVRKPILFINEISNAPVQVEVDLITNSGRVSASTSYKGELKVDMENLKEDNIDVYAYGYFFKSAKLKSGNEQQIIKLQPTDTGKKIELKNLQFVPGRALLLKESNAELNRLYLSLMMNPKRKVEVGGHINVPNKTIHELTTAQMQLSIARAKSVYDYLIKKGIPKKRLTYKGYGNSEMIFKNPENDAEKSKNRRVEVKIID